MRRMSMSPTYFDSEVIPGGSAVKNPPARAGDMGLIPECQEDPLEEGRACQPSPLFLPGESPCTEESSGLQSMGWQRVEHD